jgi:hypothetical protein
MSSYLKLRGTCAKIKLIIPQYVICSKKAYAIYINTAVYHA